MAARATSVTPSPEFWNETPLAVVRRLGGLDETTLQLSLLAIFLLVHPAVAPAEAELVSFTSGRTLSVKGPRIEGSTIVLFLRNGGEVVCDRRLVDRIEPDEAPYPVLPTVIPQPRPSSAPFADIIEHASAQHGVDPILVYAVIEVESGYGPAVRSPKGAMGSMQLMPATACRYAVVDPFDPQANIEAGTPHLKTLLDEFEVPQALAAYNAGEASVKEFDCIPHYRETHGYVARILELVEAANAYHDE